MVSGTLAPLYTAGSEAWLAGSEAWLAGSEAWLASSWALKGGMDGRTENLPNWSRLPARAQLQPKICIKRGKGTADHMMPLGDWLSS